ncbi:Arc family DNA-binding protein [Salmonella enterica]|uniref:Arc family DNA-binding protein n=1 Tax=Salmonella muenchen TaxID=596 RepID=A0A5T9YLA9_SALMU|nr:Arc family DNA-binding protein [Salmonella enterica]EAM4270642.1 Arc family DNA-binding protein [Salmonella enterica subsp. enterica serovar Muenchen]EAO6012170.1 Arc family DNA-binding protein [Salmonella enterica subsp. enterica serovar Bere]EDC4374048.1 Arc family DNA-binding protein [Salmonella enterica subsp. enterica]EJV7324984.1 Arc family DNA-binding protein [Salmonella enterica subsp. enterica serovar Altona]EKG8165751.1 Arc family DNA-binding protein [Salmonella enterica subsp. en
MSREEPQINIRISKELKAKVKARAQHNKRSMNAEIIQIIEDAVCGRSLNSNEFAQKEADKFKEALLETLKTMYGKDAK